MQWHGEELLIHQLNRKQNKLTIWAYHTQTGELRTVYTEEEDTWVDIDYNDASATSWGMEDMLMVDKGESFLRMTETRDYRQVYKINIATGRKTPVTPSTSDAAFMYGTDGKYLYYSASPETTKHRFLYRASLNGKGNPVRLTPEEFAGINKYTLSPNGRYAIHRHSNSTTPNTTRLISVKGHKEIKTLVANEKLKATIAALEMPTVEFFSVTTDDNIEIPGKLIKPANFDASKKYPVLFFVYGEPWGAVSEDSWDRAWHLMLAQQGYLIVAMDNRGTPSLKGSSWRKSIYRKVGVINAHDQAMAAKEVLKWDFVDHERTAVWGWSGGGSMTLNLMFKYPEIYKSGMAVAAVANQLYYDNIYQERYMGLPQENLQDFIDGSPISYAKNLEGNLLVIHGTGDDNVHYQNMEALINELVKHNKQFEIMSYPNRSHGIWEGEGTTMHLYTLLTNFLHKTTPAGGR